MSAILLDRDIVHYEVLGRGRPVIFLHGWLGSWRYWIPTMQATSVAFRTYAIDLWGFGDSAKQQRRYALIEQVQLLDSFLEQMGIGRFALIGHGLGAIVGLLFCLSHPESVDRLMAVSYPLEESLLNNRLRTSSPADLVDWLLGRVPQAEPVRAEISKIDPQAVAMSFVNLASIKLDDLWKQTTTPCLFVHGMSDPAIETPHLDDSNDLPVSSHAITFEQSGHFPMLDDSSKFNRLVADFLALPSGDSPRELQLKEEWKRRVR
jgi:pimeloyl-ACP methyl ester carboxylesterase